jgi:hypothetical protein
MQNNLKSKEKIMQLTIELPDHLATQLQAMPNLNEFMAKLVAQSLTNENLPQTISEKLQANPLMQNINFDETVDWEWNETKNL